MDHNTDLFETNDLGGPLTILSIVNKKLFQVVRN